MPEITRFYGIIIKMFFDDHNPPHIHALYGEYNSLINIATGKEIQGDLPRDALNLISKWLKKHREKLLAMWQIQKIEKLPPLN
jgi:hypothetical protein